MRVNRRDFLRASSAIAAAWGLQVPEASAIITSGPGPTVVWLQAQGCTGCSVSFLNSISLASAASLLTDTLNVQYHPNVMASAGASAVAVAQAARNASGYVLIVEGAIPTAASGRYCYLWPGLTAHQGVQDFARNAKYVIALGSCSAFGGMVAGKPNPTGVRSLGSIVGTTKLVNVPGCPAHPDWLVGTIAFILKEGKVPALDSNRRPKPYFEETVHHDCPYEDYFEDGEARPPCMFPLGCKGPITHADCSRRKWNAAVAGGRGVNWCVGAGNPNGTPCLGCTEPTFPDGMSPFYTRMSGRIEADDAPSSHGDSDESHGHHEVPDLNEPGAGSPARGFNYQELQNRKRAAYEDLKRQRRLEYENRKAAGASRKGLSRAASGDDR